MVNVYGNFPDGYNNPYAGNDPTPARTAAEAAAIAARQYNYRGSYSRYRGTLPLEEGSAAEAEYLAAKEAGFRGNYARWGDRPIQLARQIAAEEAKKKAAKQQALANAGKISDGETTRKGYWFEGSPDGSNAGGVDEVRQVSSGMEGEHPGDFVIFDGSGNKIADYDPSSRPGYYDTSDLGDITTVNTQKAFRLLNAAGYPTPSEYDLTGALLEFQRKQAYKTGTRKDDMFFIGELQKWGHIGVESSSEYHKFGREMGVPVPPNPFENWGDVSLAFLKAGNPKDDFARNYRFNSNVGELIDVLPERKGLQEHSWDAALAIDRNMPVLPQVSFSAAISKVSASRRTMGIYGTSLENGTPAVRSVVTTPDITVTKDFQQILSSGKNFDDTYSSLVSHYETELAKYTAGGSTDRATYEDLMAERSFLIPLGMAKSGLDNFRANLPPAMESSQREKKTYSSEIPDFSINFGQDPVGNYVTNLFAKGGYVLGLKEASETASVDASGMVESYKKSGVITPDNVFTGNTTEYSELLSKMNRALDAQGRYDAVRTSLIIPTGIDNPLNNYIAKPISGGLDYIAKGYNDIVTTPYANQVKKVYPGNPVWDLSNEFFTAAVSIPSYLATLGSQAVVGGENLSRNLQNFPVLAASGLILQGTGLFEGMTKKPVTTITQLVGTYAVLGAMGKTVKTGIGMIRTSGKTYIPIEEIGYDFRYGYPWGRNTLQSLRTSFHEGTLVPRPFTMRSGVSENVPYVPANARLPTDIMANQPVLWTAWEGGLSLSPRLRAATSGRFTLGGGPSELQGMYGSPVALGYFTKAGGQMPTVFGTGLEMLKTPSIVHSVVRSIEGVPRGLSTAGAYARIQAYIDAQMALSPGRAYTPLTKMEYEAVLPHGQVMEYLGSNYYTKLGGFGRNHLFGTRAQILEMRATGEAVVQDTSVLPVVEYKYYSGEPLISSPNLAASLLRPYYSSGSQFSKPSLMLYPSVPSRLSSPSKPSYSYKPSYQYKISSPSKLSYPSIASYPSMPSMLSLPSYPSKPSEPSYPSLPSMPSLPSYPSKPSAPSYPSPPSLPSLPSYPSKPSTSLYPTLSTPSITTTFVPTKKIRMRRRRRRKSTQEWYIWNEVPLMETVFGYQLNLKEVYPTVKMPGSARITGVKATLPKYRMPKISGLK